MARSLVGETVPTRGGREQTTQTQTIEPRRGTGEAFRREAPPGRWMWWLDCVSSLRCLWGLIDRWQVKKNSAFCFASVASVMKELTLLQLCFNNRLKTVKIRKAK